MLKLEYLVLVTFLVLGSAFQGAHALAPAKRDAISHTAHLENILTTPHDHYRNPTPTTKPHKKPPVPRSAEPQESTREDPVPKSHKAHPLAGGHNSYNRDATPRKPPTKPPVRRAEDPGNKYPTPVPKPHKKPAVRRFAEPLDPFQGLPPPIQPPPIKAHKESAVRRGPKPRSPRYPNYSGPVRSDHIKETLKHEDTYGGN